MDYSLIQYIPTTFLPPELTTDFCSLEMATTASSAVFVQHLSLQSDDKMLTQPNMAFLLLKAFYTVICPLFFHLEW